MTRNRILAGILTAIALGTAACGTATAQHPAAKPAASTPAAPANCALSCPASAAPPASTPPASTPPASTPPAAPAMTVSQQQAVQDAQGYLSDGQGFSRPGLIGQLVYDKFSTADATFAASHAGDNGLEPDWNAQAAQSAQGYVNDGQGFSRQGLIDQLRYDKFTYDQAVFGVNQAGL